MTISRHSDCGFCDRNSIGINVLTMTSGVAMKTTQSVAQRLWKTIRG